MLWLSGDGFRAALFHLGALRRVNELGLLASVGRIGAVSGGAVAAALLATRIHWPFQGAYPEWEEAVAEPLRELAAVGAAANSHQRRPFPGVAGEAALEERFARELLGAAGGGEEGRGPSFAFGAFGLALSGIATASGECAEWDLGERAPGGYDAALLGELMARLPGALEGFGEAAQAVVENHGYLVAAAALAAVGDAPVAVPHPEWMDEQLIRAALSPAGPRPRLRRLHLRPRREDWERAG